LVGRNPPFSLEVGLNNYLVFELLLAFLFACALIIPGKSFVYSAAIILFCLPALDRMYDFSHGKNTLQNQQERQKNALDKNEHARILTYLKRFSDKAIIKYVDITPLWTKGSGETFPKAFPFFVLNDLQLSSYGGITFYLSSRAEYMRKMPVGGPDARVSPDWKYLKDTGADFVVTRSSDIQRGALGSLFKTINPEDVIKLQNDVVIFSLRTQAKEVPPSGIYNFDNGYFKISPKIDTLNSNLVNIAKGKYARQSSIYGGADAMRAVDGKTEGNFTLGSVTHTLAGTNSWFEIDLGQSEPIDSVRIWNRTDCCGNRLRDYWIFISEIPFLDTDTASVLRTRPATWGQVNFKSNPKSLIKTNLAFGGVRGRYVRVQLGGDQTVGESYLSLAEVEVFRSDMSQVAATTVPHSSEVKRFTTNNANYLRLDLESSAPATVQYLFSDNPRLNYYLNGQRTTVDKRDGLNFINVPAGSNTIEIQYRHWPLIVFLCFYTIYSLVFLWALMPAKFRFGVWRKIFHRVNINIK
jgi:hypothetical protein